ncbi:E3 ubiquitin-protein ligase Siah1-like [Ostrinia nubilalis]|uniref:E3 ubiquitin-protein ligase Siah1-like n=1 Tax=Ostrinia nubilalis TaxID=29057 RepID=UPI0030825CAB
MGAEQSSSSKAREANSKFTKDEVNRMLEQQKRLFDERFQQLLKLNLDPTDARETAKQEARNEVERLMREKERELDRQRQQQSPLGLGSLYRTPVTLERERAPYSFPGENLAREFTTVPSTSDPFVSIYPNLGNAASSSSAAPSSERSVPSAPPAPRNRSVSRNRTGKATRNTKAEDDVKCPTCKNHYTSTIFQCQTGHSSCLHCKNRMARCGICGGPITNMRNIDLEHYVAQRTQPCPNKDDGCRLSFKLSDMDGHLIECQYRVMNCPLAAIFGQCSWRGKVTQMASHFDEVHQMHRQGNVDTEMRLLNVSNDNHIVYYVVIGTFNFLFHVKVCKGEGMMYMTVQLIGSQHSASKWGYEIHIYNKAEPRRKFEYKDTCNPINTPINTIVTISKCAVIPLSYANTFLNNGAITYKFYIRKENEGNNNNFGNNNRGRGPRRR